MPELTPRQLEILQHALGLDEYGQGRMYRNHFCAGGGDREICWSLVEIGYMKNHPTTQWLPYYNCSVTEAGIQAVRDESPPQLTRSQQRYRAFLHADCGYSFGEWLKKGRC